VLNNVSVSDEELENAAAYPYPVKSDITNLFDNSSADYSLNIYVENPFEFPVQARLTQGMPQNVSIISAGNGTVDGNNVSWQLELQPDERDMLNVTLNFGSLRKAEITGALLEIYDQVQDNWNAFASDNMTVYLVVLSGDVTRDFRVDIFDLASVGLAFGSSLGEANWNPNADLNGDSVINIFDLATVGLNYGKTC